MNNKIMSTARERQEREKLIKCAKLLERIGDNIVNEYISHHDTDDIIEVISQLAKSMEFIVYRDTIRITKPN